MFAYKMLSQLFRVHPRRVTRSLVIVEFVYNCVQLLKCVVDARNTHIAPESVNSLIGLQRRKVARGKDTRIGVITIVEKRTWIGK